MRRRGTAGWILGMMVCALPAATAPNATAVFFSALGGQIIVAFVAFWYGHACGKEYERKHPFGLPEIPLNRDQARKIMLQDRDDPQDG